MILCGMEWQNTTQKKLLISKNPTQVNEIHEWVFETALFISLRRAFLQCILRGFGTLASKYPYFSVLPPELHCKKFISVIWVILSIKWYINEVVTAQLGQIHLGSRSSTVSHLTRKVINPIVLQWPYSSISLLQLGYCFGWTILKYFGLKTKYCDTSFGHPSSPAVQTIEYVVC